MAAAKAATADAAEAAPAAKGGPSMMMQLIMLLVASLLAIGVGGGAGMMLGGGDGGGETVPEIEHSAGGHGEGGAEGGHGEEAVHVEGHPMVIPLAPITTNLASPAETWVRLEASMVLDEPPEAELADSVHQDLLAYLRTVRMHQVQGASGFQHLRSELDERASIRSEGKVKRVLIRTLLFE